MIAAAYQLLSTRTRGVTEPCGLLPRAGVPLPGWPKVAGSAGVDQQGTAIQSGAMPELETIRVMNRASGLGHLPQVAAEEKVEKALDARLMLNLMNLIAGR